jgi:DNA adenine methylase
MTLPQQKPFLRWAGGKRKIVGYLLDCLPPHRNRYWEPFLGAAALFFGLAPTEAFLSDMNGELIDCYRQVRRNPDLVSSYLAQHSSRTCEDYYYRVRAKYNRCKSSAAQAARFIYLNKTNFNGIFRVNSSGAYNVPYGRKEPPTLPNRDDLRAAARLLRKVQLLTDSYALALQRNPPEAGDFVYLDPPYPPLNKTASFTRYTASRFSLCDHKKLAEVATLLSGRGVLVMVSNADVPAIRQLYEGWHFRTLPVVRWIAANGTRHKVSELVITNYPPRHEHPSA